MQVTLDQARALDALAEEGTFQAAGRRLHKAHTAVVYAVRQLEEQSGLVLLDRSGYRTRLTAAGGQVLEHCRRLLAAERALAEACARMRTGWEPSLRIVLDGVFPSGPLLELVRVLRAQGAPTRVQVDVEFLEGVEQRFERDRADLMIALLPSRLAGLRAVKLPAVSARFVAHRSHPLAARKGRLSPEALAEHVLLTVRGGDPRLKLATATVDRHSSVQLGDFHAKKAAILGGIGVGWLPDWLAEPELGKGELVPLALEGGSVHAFEPWLYLREGAPGRAAERVVAVLSEPPAALPRKKRHARR